MTPRMWGYLFALFFIVTFVGLNIEHKSSISLWFTERGRFENVPIVLSLLVMYLLGALSFLPFIVAGAIRRKRREEKRRPRRNESKDNDIAKTQDTKEGTEG